MIEERAYVDFDTGIKNIADADNTFKIQEFAILEYLEAAFEIQKTIVIVIWQDAERLENSIVGERGNEASGFVSMVVCIEVSSCARVLRSEGTVSYCA